MTQPKIVPQTQFKTLEAFIEGQNNYYAHFLRDNPFGEARRNKPHFIRFQTLHPEMERELTDKVTEAMNIGQRLPYERLWDSYPLMSQLVYANDPGVMQYSEPSLYLTA